MNYKQATIRNSSRRRNIGPEPRPIRTSVSTPALSFLMAALLLVSPPTTLRNHSNDQRQGSRNRNEPSNKRTIRWAAEAMSPAADLTAAAAAAVIRRNVISGAAIFTVGDAAAQMLTSSKSRTTTPSANVAPPVLSSEEGLEGGALAKNMGRAASVDLLPASVSALDMNRLWSSTFLGAIWSGFCVPFIYGNVEKTFPGKANLKQILIKVLVTCSILSTIGNYATMFARRFIAQYTTYQFDKNSSLRLKWFSNPIQSILLFLAIFKGCFKSCNRDIREVIVDDLKIWPLYDLTCYSLIPPAWRPITTSIMSSGWAMYMSIASAKEEEEEELDSFDVSVDSSASYYPSTTAFSMPSVPAPHGQPEKTIRVTPLENPFSNVSSETTKQIIGVSGGAASNTSVPNSVANANAPQKVQNTDNNDNDDQQLAA